MAVIGECPSPSIQREVSLAEPLHRFFQVPAARWPTGHKRELLGTSATLVVTSTTLLVTSATLLVTGVLSKLFHVFPLPQYRVHTQQLVLSLAASKFSPLSKVSIYTYIMCVRMGVPVKTPVKTPLIRPAPAAGHEPEGVPARPMPRSWRTSQASFWADPEGEKKKLERHAPFQTHNHSSKIGNSGCPLS